MSPVLEYPKVMYRKEQGKDLESREVNNAKEEKALGDKWVDSPELCGVPGGVPKTSRVVRPLDTADVDTQVSGFGSLPASQAMYLIDRLQDVKQVERARTQEHARHSGSRQQVVEKLALREHALRGGAPAA